MCVRVPTLYIVLSAELSSLIVLRSIPAAGSTFAAFEITRGMVASFTCRCKTNPGTRQNTSRNGLACDTL